MHVVRLMRERGLGNTVTQLCSKLRQQHTERWLQNGVTACKPFLAKCQEFAPLPSQPPLHRPRWLMSVYLRGILYRIDDVKAKQTSTFGTILKMHSNKKVTRKLAGKVSKTAQWATDVGNEHGQILMCVLTTAEGSGI